MSKSYIIYDDVIPGMAEGGEAHFSNGTGTASQLLTSHEYTKYAGLDLNWWTSGNTVVSDTIPTPRGTNIGSNLGNVSPYFYVYVDLDDSYTTDEITLDFGDSIATTVLVWWYDGPSTVITSQTFYPNSSIFTCKKKVSGYSRIWVAVTKTSPWGRPRLERIIFGTRYVIDSSQLRNFTIQNECDTSSLTLPGSTAKFDLEDISGRNFSFIPMQPIMAYTTIDNEKKLIGTYYLKNSERKSATLYHVECEDAISILEYSDFPGLYYDQYSGQYAAYLAGQIVGNAFNLDVQCENVLFLGAAIRPGTKRSALQQLLIAWGAFASTDQTGAIRISKPEISFNPITKDKTFYGVTMRKDAIVTKINLASHYLIADTSGDIEIAGNRYKDTITWYSKENPNASNFDRTNEVTVRDALMVTASNAERVLENLYQYYLMQAEINAEIVWEGQRLGSYVTQVTGWNDWVNGVIEKQTLNISNIVVAKNTTRSIGDGSNIQTDTFRSGEIEAAES